ncbi:MAG TPA: chemotaxis protein CheW [Dongiaceae bacterium]|nr:chemotaxis protein CheW [Dongiaceae bacterium]
MAYQSDDSQASFYLLCRAADRFCAFPVEQVSETMRVLPISSMTGLPDVIRGVSVIRGIPTPVLDLSKLVDGSEVEHHRIVTINLGPRIVALLVQAVLGVRPLSPQSMTSLPPLLRNAADKAISAVGILDKELLLFLTNLRVLADTASITLDEMETSQ